MNYEKPVIDHISNNIYNAQNDNKAISYATHVEGQENMQQMELLENKTKSTPEKV